MPKFLTLIRGAMVLSVFASFGFFWNPNDHCLTHTPAENIPTESFSNIDPTIITIDIIMSDDPTDCDTNDGSIVVQASGAASLEFSIDGGIVWQSFNTFNNLNAGTYSVIVREQGTTCVSGTIEIVLVAPNAPTIQEIVTSNPSSCDISNGVIAISATNETGTFEYSIDGGLTWQSLNSFQGLSSGAYQISVRNSDETCAINGGLVSLIGDPTEPQISDIFLSNPTDCGVTDGIITIVLSNASEDFEYSIDNGSNWVTTNSFENLGGDTYELLVRRIDGTCEVSGSTVELAEPIQPIIDSVNPINPTNCVSMDGTIVIQANPGIGFLEYSVDGGDTWLTSNTFFNLMEGIYDIAVRNTSGSCITIGETVQIVAPTEPAIDNIFVSDPSDCVAANGGIIVSATGCGLGDIEYSIDDGVNWELDGAFPDLPGGDYEILIRNVGEVTTISTGILTLITPVPAVIDTVDSTEPDCSGAGGSISITATGNDGDLEYSIDGGTSWQGAFSFENLIAGTYNVAVRFPTSGCITLGDNVTLTSAGNNLLINEITSENPGCGNPNGTITITIVTSADLEFTINGGTDWQLANFFDNLPIGTYMPGARIAGGGCETITDDVALIALDAPEIQGVTFTDISDCGLSNGTITIAATPTTNIEFSIDGGNTWLESNSFTDLASGIYSVVVRNIDGSCPIEYDLNPITISEPTDAPALDEIQITNPSACATNNGGILITASGTGVIEYSIDSGQTFQFENDFTNLPAGVYDIVLQFTGSNCQTIGVAEIDNGTSCQDTINVEVPFETDTEICLDGIILQIDGTITDAEFCNQGSNSTVFAPIINNNCVMLFPANGFLGLSPDTICVIHCYDNDPDLCDTTFIVVTVTDDTPPCEEVFNVDTITVLQNGNPTEICIPVPTLDAFNSNLFLNGEDYNDVLMGCLEDSVIFYTYALLSGGGFDGPFTLDSWTVDGMQFSGTFENAVELVNLMNDFDPSGSWTIDTDLSIIVSQNADGNYGNMNIIHDSSGNMTTLQTNVTAFPNGTIVNITETGVNEFVVTDPVTGCSDTLYIEVEVDAMPAPVPSDTLISTLLNTPTDEILIDDSELPGGINTLVLCGLPENGGVGFPNNSFVYNPNTDFIGKDTFCIQACNADNPAICDTLNVIVCVLPPIDTLTLELMVSEVIDTCLTDLIQLPDGISTAEICGVNVDEITATLNNDCINLDPQDGFTGQTEICVVHCDENGNCDTTIIIINVSQDCPDIFPVDFVEVMTTMDPTPVCLPISSTVLANTNLLLDGVAYNGSIDFCDDGMGGLNVQILVLGIGMHTFTIENIITGCSDDIQIIITEGPNVPDDTIFVTIPQGTQNEEICGNGDELIGNPFNVGFCPGQEPTNGTAPISGDSCVAYTPGPDFFGMDEFCMIICDDLIPTSCDTFIVIITVTPNQPPMDTLFIDVENTMMAVDTCLDGQFLQLPGNIASAVICGINNDDFDSFVLSDNCLSLDLVDDFTGTTEVCVVHCDDSVPEVCDTTIVIISSEELPCPDIFSQDTVTLINPTPDVLEYCIPILPADILNYDLTLDGIDYDGPFSPCDVDSIFIYNYSLVSEPGPYDIEWDAGFGNFDATVGTIEELIDSMNVWDTNGNWMNNSMGNIIISDNELGMYGVLMITQVATQISNDLQPDFTGVPLGTFIAIDTDGNHVLIVENIETGCTDTLVIEIVPTIFIETTQNTLSETFCLDTLNLPGNFDTLLVCSEPSEGMILIDGNCFTYLPLGGFIGMDTACVMVCDDMMNCDSTLVIITVTQLCNDFGFLENDTLNFELDICPTNAEICLPVTLDSLLMNYNIQDNGSPYSEGFAGCEFDTCINYSSFSIPDLGDIGPYTLNSWIVGDDTFSGSFMNLGDLIDSMNLWNPGINWTLNTTTGNIRGCNITETYGDLQITQDLSGQMAIVDAVPDFFPNGSRLFLTEGFHELVFLDIEGGCTDTLFTQVNCPVDSTTCGTLALSSSFILVDDCADTGEFCVDISVFDAADFLVTIGDTIFSALSACSDDPQFVSVVLPVGDHQIVFEDTVKMCVDTFDITISCELFEDITIDTTVNEDGSLDICLEDLEFPLMEIDSVINVCADQSTGNVDFSYDDITGCITILGELEGFDTACFKVYLLDTCATVFINVEVLTSCMIDLVDVDNIGVGVTDCNLGLGDICLPIPFVEFPDYTLEVGGVEYAGDIVPCDFDSVYTIFYSQFPSGGQLGPYIINSWCINGIEVTGVVDSPQDLVDSLAIWDPGCEWGIQVDGSVTTIVGGCSSNVYCEQMVVEQELNPGAPDTIAVNQNFFPNGTQITLAIGSFDLMLTDTMGCFDLVTATLECIETDTFIANIPIDSTMTYCVDTTDLPGNLVSIFNACPEQSGEFVQFTIVNDTCVTYTGIEVGIDTACIVICDDLGVCDTTYLFITTTTDETEPPIANDDGATSGEEEPPVIINVINNDENIFVIDDIFVLVPPNFGDVEYLGNGDFQYVPDDGYCDSAEPDSFTYVVCNTIGCDTATVYITILCTNFEIFSGFSPNTDEVNDTWVIRGISTFEDHIVRIYNRWGSLMYETRDYHLNEWTGKWNGEDVPDGTYFYVIDLGEGEIMKGYVQIRR